MTSENRPLIVRWREAVGDDATLSSSATFVGWTVSMTMSPDGRNGRQGQARIARITKLGERTVRNALDELVRKGWLHRRNRGGGRTLSTAVYDIRMPTAEPAALAGTEPALDAGTDLRTGKIDIENRQMTTREPAPGAGELVKDELDELGDARARKRSWQDEHGRWFFGSSPTTEEETKNEDDSKSSNGHVDLSSVLKKADDRSGPEDLF